MVGGGCGLTQVRELCNGPGGAERERCWEGGGGALQREVGGEADLGDRAGGQEVEGCGLDACGCLCDERVCVNGGLKGQQVAQPGVGSELPRSLRVNSQSAYAGCPIVQTWSPTFKRLQPGQATTIPETSAPQPPPQPPPSTVSRSEGLTELVITSCTW